MQRIAVFVSGGGTDLQSIIDYEKSGQLKNGKIELVISNRKKAYGLERARMAGIEARFSSNEESQKGAENCSAILIPQTKEHRAAAAS